MVVLANQTRSHRNAELSAAAFTALGSAGSAVGGSLNNTGLYGSLPIVYGSAIGNGHAFDGNVSSIANFTDGMRIDSSTLMTSKRGFQELRGVPMEADELKVTGPEIMPDLHKSSQRIRRSNAVKILDGEDLRTAHRLMNIITSGVDSYELWARVNVPSLKEPLRRLMTTIGSNVENLGLKRDDLNCLSLMLIISDSSCYFDNKLELNVFAMYWRLVQILELAMDQSNLDTEERLMDAIARATAHTLNFSPETSEWIRSDKFVKGTDKLVKYMTTNGLWAVYNLSEEEFKRWLYGDVNDLLRTKIAKELIEMPPSTALTMMKEIEPLNSIVDKKYREGLASGKLEATAICEGFSVQEGRDMSNNATNIFSRYHSDDADELLYALHNNPQVPREITESLLDATIHENLDGKLAEKLGPVCEFLANQTDVMKMENIWQSCLQPGDRAADMATRLPTALNLNVDDEVRVEFLKKNEAGMEDFRRAVARQQGPDILNMDLEYVLNSSLPGGVNNSTNYTKVAEILKGLPNFNSKLVALTESHKDADYATRKDLVFSTGRALRNKNLKEGKAENVNALATNITNAASLPYGEYRKMHDLAVEAKMHSKIKGPLQKEWKDASSALNSLSSTCAALTDEFNTLDCIWNSVLSRNSPTNTMSERALKGYIQAFIKTTKSGAENSELQKYFSVHKDRVNKFLELLDGNEDYHSIYAWLDDSVHAVNSVDWHQIGSRLKELYRNLFV